MQADRIVDAHHHLWDLSANTYPWLNQRGVRRFFGDPTPIQKNYEIRDYRADIGELPVVASVHIQVGVVESASVNETRWLQQVADTTESGGMPNAIVAYADLSAPHFETQFALHRESQNLRGIRQIVGRHPVEDHANGGERLLENRIWRKNLSVFSKAELSFDLQLLPSQLLDAFDVFAAHPDLPVAICHAGSPGAEPEAFSTWQSGVTRWASLPQAYCKISGFGMFDPHWSARTVRRYFDVVLSAFGPDRVMLGSNFPVEKLVKPYAAVWREYDDLCTSLNREEKNRLFSINARRFYRIS